MEKLKRSNARFCAKYVKFVGVGYTKRPRDYHGLEVNGEKFKFSISRYSDFKVGELVYIAKRIPTPRGQDQKWEIHQIELPESYWSYEYYEKMTPKEKRVKAYNPYPETWFGSKSYIVEKV